MDWTSWGLSFLLVVFSIFPFYGKIKKYLDFHGKVNRLPGPRSIPLIGTAYLFLGKTNDVIFEKALEISKKHAKEGIFRFWHGPMAEVILLRCEYAEKIFRSSRIIEKSDFYNFIKPWLGEGLLTSTGPKWFKHRKIITPTFHFSVLENFCTVFGENCKILVDQLSKVSDNEKAVDVYPFITRAALDIICETAMGIKVNAQVQKERNQYTDAVYNFSSYAVEKVLNPLMHIDFLYQRSDLCKNTNSTLKILHDYTTKVIKDRKLARSLEGKKKTSEDDVGSKKRIAFLDMLLDANENENNLTDTDIREEVDTFLFEGHDTTTVGISWALVLISMHPAVQNKLQEEFQQIFGDDKTRSASMHELNQMNYLERVIKESLRICPSVPVISRKMDKDMEIGGYIIPKDCTVSLDILMIHQDERHFPDPEKFDPDRFLPENSENRHPYAYVPFSAGMRNCIGQKFAILEEKAVLSSVLRNFKIKTPYSSMNEIKRTMELVLRPTNGIDLIFETKK